MRQGFITFVFLGILTFIIMGLFYFVPEPKLPEQIIIPQERIVKLYYYNSSKDIDSEGNIACSKNGLESVERTLPVSEEIIKDTIRLLLKGELTAEERERGIETEYPLTGLVLEDVLLKDGILTLTFNDQENKTVGGACRVTVLWSQIEETARQFEGVTSVEFLPQELFQP